MRCLLSHFVRQELWAQAAVSAAFCVNIVPNSTRNMEIPYAIWYCELPSYLRLHKFGCAVLAYVDKVERQKMYPKAREAIFVGYNREKPGSTTCGNVNTSMPIAQYLGIDQTEVDDVAAMIEAIHDEDSIAKVVMIEQPER
ncbi:unnamed protein product [Phytophthora lilii]|uniref:Unnamed protein product n=1 Tax=Phytophthora lilii TaxID=2077276 RepID=A0A9W6WUI7_9STRA|nr:unnamed protein product [Phytophthora lilii]